MLEDTNSLDGAQIIMDICRKSHYHHKISCNIIGVRRRQNRRHVTETFEGIQASH